MKKLHEMTPEEMKTHFEWINSGEAAKAWEEHYTKLERVLEKVTDEVAAERELQEIVWDPNGTIRFRENILVSRLIGSEEHPHRPSGLPEAPWMLEQMTRLMDPDTGNTIVRWLKENGPADLNQIAEQGILEMDGRGFSQKDHEQFAMLHGYSVNGAGDLSYFSRTMINRADIIAARMVKERKRAQ